MWPFDSILLNRIKDLERTVEVYTGANQILTQELEKSQQREATLLEKLFKVSGIDNQIIPAPREKQDPIKIGNTKVSWQKVKQDLEMEAKRKYWEEKAQQSKIKDLEEEILDKKA